MVKLYDPGSRGWCCDTSTFMSLSKMSAQFEPLNQIIIAHWDSLKNVSNTEESIRALDGHNLDVATVLAVARYLFNSVYWAAQS